MLEADHPMARAGAWSGDADAGSPARTSGALTRGWRALAVAAALIGAPSAATAQQAAAIVNGDLITTLDVAQRIKLTELSTHKVQSRQEALDELIDEKLKLQVAKRYVVEISDKEVNLAFDGIARRAGTTTQKFADSLTAAGISVPALKARLKADIAWSQIIRGKFQSTLQIGEKDILDALQARKKDDKPEPVTYQYSLRQILFIVARGSPGGVFDARAKEAEALRARFQSCEEGVPIARSMRDVAVREAISRASSDVPQQQREILDKTAVGHLTPPDTTLQGVEMFAICAKDQVSGESPGKREVREELTNERFQTQAKRYLLELRRSAMIEIR
jgi:peptidyl-prolyl cis-trans isomerase SurA